MACLSAKPVVDGIERDLKGRAQVVRVSIHGSAGRTLAERYGMRFVPTLLLFDPSGREAWRQEGFPSRGETVRQVESLVKER